MLKQSAIFLALVVVVAALRCLWLFIYESEGHSLVAINSLSAWAVVGLVALSIFYLMVVI